MHLYGSGNSFSDYIFMLLLTGVIGCTFSKNNIHMNKIYRGFLISICILGYIGLWIFVTRFNVLPAIKFSFAILLFLFFFIIQESNERSEVLLKYRNVVFIIAIVSLFFWLLGSILHFLHPSGIVQSVWTGTGDPKVVPSYHGFYFETQELYGVIRNTAIFTEAPMSSLHFSIAMLVEVYVDKKKSLFKIFLFSIAILSSFSTTGIILLIVVLLHQLFTTRMSSKFIQIIRISVLPIFFLVVIFVVRLLLQAKLETSSGSIRTDDFIVGTKAWLLHPIWGNGYMNYDTIKQFMASWRNYNTGFSNSITMVLAYGGIYLALLYVFPIIFNFKNIKKEGYLPFLLGVVYLFTFTIIPFEYLTMMLIIFFSTYSSKTTSSSMIRN